MIQGFTCESGAVVFTDRPMLPMRVYSLSIAILFELEDEGGEIGVVALQIDGHIKSGGSEVGVIEVMNETEESGVSEMGTILA